MTPERDSRERIVEAARRQFLARDYDGATLRAIARAARVTTGSLYHHFTGKDELLVEVCLRGLRRLLARLRTAVVLGQGRPAAERLVTLFDAYAAFFMEEHGYYELIERLDRGREDGTISPALADRLDPVSGEVFEALHRVIREARPDLAEEAVHTKGLLLLALADGLLSCQRRGLLGRFGLSLGSLRARIPIARLLSD
jgi:AcrR family transcriptional regulator